jgi:hypothetical protein
MLKDYYKILEIEENFTEDEIKKKYRDLSKKYHPDINPGGAEKFKEISEAYDVLSTQISVGNTKLKRMVLLVFQTWMMQYSICLMVSEVNLSRIK